MWSSSQRQAGHQGFRFSNENNLEIWIKPLANNEWAMTFVNMKDELTTIDFNWKKHDIGDNLNNRFSNVKNIIYKIRDLYNHKDLGTTSRNLKAEIGSHDVLMIRLSK